METLKFSLPERIKIRLGESYDLAQHIAGGTPPYKFTSPGLPVGLSLTQSLLSASMSAQPSIVQLDINVADSEVVKPPIDPPPVVVPPTVVPPVPGTAKPVSMGKPRIYGTFEEGQILRGYDGSWLNGPTMFKRQWKLGGKAIPDGQEDTYRITRADAMGGLKFSYAVTASNSFGAAVPRSSGDYGSAVPATAQAAPTLYSDPPSILGRARVGEPLTVKSAMWDNTPGEITFQLVRIAKSGEQKIGDGASIYWPVDADVKSPIVCDVTATNPKGSTTIRTAPTDPVAPRLVHKVLPLPKFGMLAEVGGAESAFTFAQGFGPGAIPAGKVPVLQQMTRCQGVPISTHPDGSVRLAWISGTAPLSAGVRSDWQIAAATPAKGTAPSLASLRAALKAGYVQVGGYETIQIADLVSGDPADIFGNGNKFMFQGPECSYWVWRKRVAGSNLLEVFVPIRLYKGGQVEFDIPWLQNGDLFVPNPQHFVGLRLRVMLNNTVRYDETVTVQSHRTLPLVRGKSVDFSHWYGDSPKIRPLHDTTYLSEVGLLPRYRDMPPPSDTELNGHKQEYVPNWMGECDQGEASRPGFEPVGVVPMWTARWVTSKSDQRAYDTMMANGLASGVREVHYRDGGGYGEDTGLYPRQSSYPQITLFAAPSIPRVPAPAEAGVKGEPGYVKAGGWPTTDSAHQAAWNYGPWIATGSLFFLEEMQAFCTWNYMGPSYGGRLDSEGIYSHSIQTRGVAWNLRTLGQLCAVLPDSHALRGEWFKQLANNAAYTFGWWVDGSNGSDNGNWRGAGSNSNTMGVIYDPGGAGQYLDPGDIGPSATRRYGSPWMSCFNGLAWKAIKDLNLSVTPTTAAQIDGSMRHSMILPVKKTGGMGSRYPWTQFDDYAMPMRVSKGSGGRWLPTMYESYKSYQDGWNRPLMTSQPPAGSQFNSRKLVTPEEWAVFSRLAPLLALLANAVDEDVPDAAKGMTLLEGSQKFSTSFMKNDPAWALAPRDKE